MATRRRPRIIFTSRVAVTEAGGVESAVREIVRAIALHRPDWNVRCIAAFRRRTRLNAIPFLGDLIAGTIVASRTRGADAVVINGGEYAWPRVLGRRARAATVVVWHGTRVGEIPALQPRMSLAVRIYYRLEVWLQRFALLAARQIAVSETTRSELHATYGTQRTIAMIPNGAPAPRWSAADAASARHPVPKRVVWLGTTAYKKGLDLAIDACRSARTRHPELRLAVIGLDAAAATRDAARASAADETWIDYFGRIDHAAALTELRHCSIFLGTSRYEGCSVAVIEALSLGIPIVAAPSIAWMIGDGGIAVADYEPGSYARALDLLLEDRVLRTRCASGALEAALAFDWTQAALGYAREIEICLERHSTRAGGSRCG